MISIIIPGYNCSSTIAKTLDSLMHQTFDDFEIIFVDDGSSDNTREIVNNVFLNCSMTDRCQYIYQDNSGPGAARNNGILNASGELIVFVDSDDVVCSDFLKCLFDGIVRSESDLCVGNYFKVNDRKGKQIAPSAIKNTFVGCVKAEDAVVSFIQNKSHISLWNSIFRKDKILFNNIRFKEKRLNGEDVLFILMYLSFSQKVSFIDSFVYTYHYDPLKTRNRALKESFKNREDCIFWPLVSIFELNMMKRAKEAIMFGLIPLEAMHELIKNAHLANSYKSFKSDLFGSNKDLLAALKTSRRVFFKNKTYFKMRILTAFLSSFPSIAYRIMRKKYNSFY